MDFYTVLDQVLALLRQRGRVSYRALKRQFDLDDAYLDDLKVEIIEVHQCAVDQEGTMLVWTGEAASAAPPKPVQAPAPLTYTPPYLADKILTSKSALEGERKQVTVLFADLKGSMELLADRDPEEARQLLDPVLERLMAAVHRFEGTVNQVMGDGIMALFGAPLAHEDHAVRACYAALAMQATMRRYAEEVRRTHGVEVQIRVGLNSGEVVVRAIGNDLHMDYSAVGQTTHLAARMEQLAAPGSIRLTAETLRLAQGLVQVTALGPVPVKGLAEPVEVYELVGASTLRGRFQAGVVRGLTRFVGRDQELVVIQQALAQAQAGHGQVVALVGEAGVGKSRLVYEVVHIHQTQGWRVLESASVSYGKATPYFPIIDLLKRYCHVDDGDDVRTIRAKVTGQVLILDALLQDTMPALLSLLDVLPTDSSFLTLDPPQRRQRTLNALKRVLLRESQVQPLLLVCEDLHWIDTETQALLDSLVDSLPPARLVLLVTYRPEYQHGWSSKTYYTEIRLDPLALASADALLQGLLGDHLDLLPLKQLLITRTQGNPFFLEESVRALVETGRLVGERGAYRLAQAVSSLRVPATVQAVLAARIDRLSSEAKHLLQTAAVIGLEVPLPLLETIAQLPTHTLYRSLAHLQTAEFLYETQLFPERVYTFKHALTYEVAYGGLLQERRRTLHTQIMNAIETLYADRVAEQVDQLAHHALRGEVWEKALSYCRQAGAKAALRSAHRGAVAYWEQALVALQHLPATRDALAQAIDVRFDLRNALWPLGEHKQIFEYLSQAEALAETLADQRRLGILSSFMTQHFRLIGDPARAIASGQRALAIATTLGDFPLQVETNFRLGRTYDSFGDYQQAAVFFRRNVVALEGDLLFEHFGLPGSLAVLSRAWLALCLAELGEFSEGITRGEEAVRMAQAIDHPYSLVSAYCGIGGIYLCKGDLSRAISALERSLGLCQTWNFPVLFPTTATHLGYAYALSGRYTDALTLLEQAVTQAAATEPLSYYVLFLVRLGETYLMAGQAAKARECTERALVTSHSSKVRGGPQAWALRLRGELAVQHEFAESHKAETSYRQALALAEELGMRPLMAHCHLGLGLLYNRRGDRAQAQAEWSMATAQLQALEMPFWISRTMLPVQML